MEEILIITTGGTIDKVYFDAKSDYQVGSTIIGKMLADAHVTHPFQILEVLQKDSLELDDRDRQLILDTVRASPNRKIVITHGTDTMTDTAQWLCEIPDRTIVMTGSLAPARFAESDALFNIGMAMASVQSLEPGVYIAMNGTIFRAKDVTKNRDKNRFELKEGD
jgi:L-asparaginase